MISQFLAPPARYTGLNIIKAPVALLHKRLDILGLPTGQTKIQSRAAARGHIIRP